MEIAEFLGKIMFPGRKIDGCGQFRPTPWRHSLAIAL
jgi:hypothetical protein